MFRFQKGTVALAAAVCMISFSGMAYGQATKEAPSERSGLYLSLTGGYTMPDQSDFSAKEETPIFTGRAKGQTDLDDGWMAGGAIGAYAGIFRFEFEGAYRSNDFDRKRNVQVTGGTGELKFDGDIESITTMVNAYIDIPLADRWTIYVGGGVGAAFTKADYETKLIGPTGATFKRSGDPEDTQFAYQGMAGIGYKATDKMTITLGYRIFHTNDYSFDRVDVDSPWIQAAEIGLRWDL